MHAGISGLTAPPLRDVRWSDGGGMERKEFSLDELGSSFKILFFFQHACPGCHSHGFPTLVRLVDRLSNAGVGFAAIQTAFEDLSANSLERVFENRKRYGLQIPFGHADPEPGTSFPRIMADYQTGGTPWFVGIGPDNQVVFNDFHVDDEALVSAMRVILGAVD